MTQDNRPPAKTQPRPSQTPANPLLGTLRTFARVWFFDIACPHCGRVHQITRHTPIQIYNRRTGILCCLWCRSEYAIGLLIYRLKHRKTRLHATRTPGGTPIESRRKKEARRRYLNALKAAGIQQPPPDWTPTVSEALQLREHLQLGLFQPDYRDNRKKPAPRNVLAPDCTCEIGPPLRADPACPVHATPTPAPVSGEPDFSGE